MVRTPASVFDLRMVRTILQVYVLVQHAGRFTHSHPGVAQQVDREPLTQILGRRDHG